MSEVNEAQLLLGQAIQLGTLIGCECNRLGIDICTRKCNESKVWDLIRQARTLIQGEQVPDGGDSVAPAYGVSLGHPYYGQLMDAYERGQKDGAAPCVERVSRCPLSVVENLEGTWDILVEGRLTHPRLTQWTKGSAEEAVRIIHEAYSSTPPPPPITCWRQSRSTAERTT